MPIDFLYCSFDRSWKWCSANVELKGTKEQVAGSLSFQLSMGGSCLDVWPTRIWNPKAQPSLGLAVLVYSLGTSCALYRRTSFGYYFWPGLVPACRKLKIKQRRYFLNVSVWCGSKESRFAAAVNGSVNGFVGSFVFSFALGLTKHFFGTELVSKAQALSILKLLRKQPQGQTIPQNKM